MQIQADNIIILVVSITLIFLVGGLFLVIYVNLYNEKKRKHQEEKESLKRQFSQTLLQTQLEIKEQTLQQVSQELHDNFGQIASLIKINLNTIQLGNKEKAAEKIEDTLDLTRRLIMDLKSLSVSMGSDNITRIGLENAIRTEADRLNRTGQFSVNLLPEGDIPMIGSDKTIILFRMVQEVLNNIIKHSQAKKVDIRLKGEEKLFTLALSDDGTGFNVEEKMKSGGSGLHNLESRAKLLGGRLSIYSSQGSGTEIIIELPL